MSFRFKNIALAALCCALTTGLSAWADTVKTNPVTGESETYVNTFTGGTEKWNDGSNWDTSTTPFISGNYDPALVDDNTASTSTAIDGYQLRVGAYGGASVTWSGGISKIQAGSTGSWLTADETSSITIASFAGNQLEGSDSAPFKLSSANVGGISWSAGLTSASNTSLPFWYYLKGTGTVVYGGDITVANAQVIKQADITLSGTSRITSKTLVTFGSGTTKTFAADATIKRLDSEGTDLGKDAKLAAVNTTGTTTLTASDSVGVCELVQTSTGIDLYWVDGDPAEIVAKTYLPSININFCYGNNKLTTAADVGVGDYAVPGTSWANMVSPSETFTTPLNEIYSVDTTGAATLVSGASVAVSGTRGSYRYNDSSGATTLYHGYIDDRNNGSDTPTITVEGVPYYAYKLVVYFSNDTDAKQFGYISVNGANFKGDSGTTISCEGTSSDKWGSSNHSSWTEGGNYLVTPAITNLTGKLTLISHDLAGCRAGVAAIQLIEVKPEITENDLEIPVSGDTVYTVSTAKDLSGTVYLTGTGTLTLNGSAKIKAAVINVGAGVTLNVNADRLDGTTFTGPGTVVYSNSLPATGKGWTDDTAWAGTVWINGKSGVTDFNANSFGNANSTVKLSGVDGWISAPFDNTVPVVLENGAFGYALKLTGGKSPDTDNPTRCTTFVKVSGGGTIVDDGSESPMLKIYDGSGFSGAITSTRARVVFCSATSTTLPGNYYDIPEGSIYVDAGNTATVASGKTWTADGGFIVDGTLNVDGTLASSAEVAVSGSGTVTFTGVPSPTGGAWWKNAAWTGTVELKGVTNLNGNDYLFNEYGNDGSTVKLTDCSGWLKTNYTCVPALEIGGTFTWNDGGSGLNNTFKVATLKGSGTISIPNQGAQTAVWQITEDWSGFTGQVVGNNSAARRVLVFGPTLPATIVAGEIYISEGATLNLNKSSGAWWGVGMGFVVDGTVVASDRSKWGGGTAMTLGDTGVLELVSTGNDRADIDNNNDYSNITGTGTIKYSSTAGWRTFPSNDAYMPVTTLTIQTELADSLILPTKANGETVIGNLAGSKNIRSDWSNTGSDGRILTVTQSKDTEWSGKFVSNRITKFNVAASTVGTPGTLTLSGANDASIPMQIDAAVNLSGTWKGNTTVNGTFGGVGTLTGNLTFNSGAYLKAFDIDKDADSDGLKVTGTVTYPTDDSKIKVDISAVDLDGFDFVPLLSYSGISSEDASKFELADTTRMLAIVVKDGVLGLEKNNDLQKLYNDSVTFTLNNVGSTPITDYTLLVRISEQQLPGFMYERVGDYKKIAFMDGDGRILSYDVDTWNPHGESLVWVKVPKAADGKTITFYWSLKYDAEAPVNVSSNVWSNYAGVWHMNDAKDASGNSDEGTLHANSVKRSDGKFGVAYGRTEKGVKGPIATIPKSVAMDNLTADGAFTVSAWVRLNADSGLNYPYFFSRKDVNATAGWGVQLDGGSSSSPTKLWANGSNSISFDGPSYKANDWVYMSVVLANGSATMFVDGVQYGPTTSASFVPATDTSLDFYIGGARADDTGSEGGRTNTLNGDMDEVRLYKGAVSADQVKAEYANIQQADFINALEGDGKSFLVPGVVVKDGVEYDYWVKSPTVTPNYWNTNDVPAVVTYTEGVLRSGSSVTNWCENLLTHKEYDVSSDTLCALPVGTYRIHCARKDAESATITSETWVDFIIAEDSGTATVGDTAGGRILLMNNDFSKGDGASATNQGYSDTNETASVYWMFTDRTPSGISTMNVMDGTNSMLMAVNGAETNKLWHLMACRHGNTFPKISSDLLVASQNYLPWSKGACSFTNGTVVAQSGADAGQILMLNTTDAAVYSPCYDEGIGTIYFDAVNGWNDDLSAYQLIVQYATATTNGDPVVDANLWQYDDDGNVTNYYGNLDETCWQDCEVNVARITGGDTVDTPVTYSGAFNLEVEPGRPTTTGEFYRVYAKLDMREPVRFRIRRTSVDVAEKLVDGAYLLLDNIIVSYPAMGASLTPAGWYDETKKGANVLGFEGSFTKPFPAVGDTVHGRAVVNYYVNSSQPLSETNFFSSAKMHYRWRYLKTVSEWKSVALDPDDDFRSAESLELPEDVGDIEFWYEYVLQAPYYSYVDYTGLPNLQSAFAAQYSEATLGPQTNRSTKVDFSYPTFGNDWFVRLRASSSSNEVWRIFVRNADGSAYTTEDGTVEYVDLALTDTGSWRGFLRTPAAVEGGLEYRVEQINPQTDDADFAFSTNCWKGVAELTDSIKSVNLTAAAAGEWSTVPCAATTGFLMFVLDEGTPSLSVTSADVQNFDKWNDANKNDRLFVGTSAEDDKKSGVSHTMRTYDGDFDMWAPSLATNRYWNESFIATIGSAGFPGYTTLDAGTKTPNGWTAGKGMWIYGKFKDTDDANTMALQMAGRGEGYLAFTGAAENPRGIESISLRSRIAETVSPSDFGYNDNVHKGLTNYTFIVQAAMSTNIAADTSWDSRFDGLGQISVIGGYRVNKGGYELRITRWKATRYRAELCKWVGNKCTVLKECLATFNEYTRMPYTVIEGQKYPTLFISVDYQADGSCKVQAGFSGESGASSESVNGHSESGKLPNAGNYIVFSYTDTTPPTTYGSYGIASANCEAVFTGARLYGKAADGFDDSQVYVRSACDTFNDGFGSSYVNEDIEGDWTLPVRFTYDGVAKKIFSVAEAQKLLVQWKRHGESELEWKTISTNIVSSYTLSDTITIPVLFKDEADIRIKHGGSSSDDNCVDLVVDDVSVRQWRGDDYDNTKTQKYFKNILYGSPTNFVFTSAWLNEEGSVELTAARAATNAVSSLRSPLFDGDSDTGRGVGLGMFSFSYTNADSRAKLTLQIATNVTALTLAEYTKLLPDESRWTDVATFEFNGLSEEELAGGVMSHYLGLHGVKGAMRLVVDPDTVAAAEAAKDPTYGRIYITEVLCRDEPTLDSSCWWGWNIRTGEDLYSDDDKLLMNLSDWPGSGGAGAGMSFALNNSVVDDTETSDPLTYRQHQPFLQTPIFTNNTAVGEITFKARRYDMPSEITARVCVYGANPYTGHIDTNVDTNWTYVTHFDITNDYYRTYTKKFKGASYEALRLVVVGMENVAQKHGKPTSDAGYKDLKDIVRVALDDVVVTEALMPKLAFRNVFVFRGDEKTDLLDTKYVDRFGDPTAQPLAGEGWGVQAEIVAEQLPDEIDFDRGIEVTLYWYDGDISPWGYSNWESKGGSVVHRAKLAECEDKDLAFRSSFNDGHSGTSVVGQSPEYEPGTTVQYMLSAAYYLKESDDPQYTYLTQDQWTKPTWYRGIDLNSTFGGFTAYTVLDSVAPGWAWINEVNVFGGYEADDSTNRDRWHQYVEVAFPVEADLSNWHLEFVSKDSQDNIHTAVAHIFSADPTTGRTKTDNAASNCVYYVISSPDSKNNLEALTVDGKQVKVDATWQIPSSESRYFLGDGNALEAMTYPIAMRLVRPSGIIEHAITLEGTNFWYGIAGLTDYSAETYAEILNAKTSDSEWVAVGDDSIAGDHSLGVTNLTADVVANWNNTMARTPGFINVNQKIDPKHPVANGATYIVYATFADDSAGHVTQTLGADVDTTSLAMAVVRKGFSTNIIYNVENWYELASVKVDGAEQTLAKRTGSVEVTVGGPATSNNVNVVASSRVDPILAETYGLTSDNRYTPAVVDWLNRGTTIKGAFANPAGPLALAPFMQLSLKPDCVLTLTEMYWLDIDPTADYNGDGTNDWWFVGGMKVPSTPKYVDDPPLTNITMGACLYLTNAAPSGAYRAGESFAPYALRGAEAGSVSTNYAVSGSWDGPTFRIIGRLFENVGDVEPTGDDEMGFIEWVALRWFVFDANSFRPKGASDEFQSYIEIVDPYSTASVAFTSKWHTRRGTSTIFYKWSIDDGGGLSATETLCPTNWLDKLSSE